MFIAGLLVSNRHKNKWCCAAKTPTEVYRYNFHSALDSTLPRFALYGKNPRIHELRTFGCDIYPITLFTKKIDNRRQ